MPPSGESLVGARSIRWQVTTVAALSLAALTLLVPLAFWPQYLGKPFAGIDRYTHLHAIVGSLWMLLLLGQVLLINIRRKRLHRLMGRTSFVLAPLFVISAGLLSHWRLVSMTEETFLAEGFAHYLPFYASVTFALAYVLGMVYRKDAAAHGRFMLCTGIPLVDPVIGRVLFFHLPPLPAPWVYQAITFTLATTGAAFLVFSYHRRNTARRALLAWFAVLVVLELGWFVAPHSPGWLTLVRWFRAQPLI